MIRPPKTALIACICALFLVTSLVTSAQQQWKRVEPFPTMAGYNDVAEVAPDTWVACGARGCVVRSEDNGVTWSVVNFGDTILQRSMSFGRGGVGCIVGDSGLVRMTFDKGLTWETISVQTNENLNGVSFFDDSTGLIVGNFGVMRLTTDGGEQWNELTPVTSGRHILSVRVTNRRIWHIGGGQGTTYRTEDGGATWKLISKYPMPGVIGRPVYSISTPSDSTIIIAGLSDLSRSDDAGRSWTKLTPDFVSQFYPSRIMFPSVNEGYYYGEGGVEYTRDGGKSWSITTTGGTTVYRALVVNAAGHGVAVGTYGTIHTTADAGVTWVSRSGLKDADLSAVAWLDNNTVLAFGNSVFRSTNAGRSWVSQTLPIPAYITSVQFCDSTHGWALVKSGYPLATTDGGATWSRMVHTYTYNMLSISFIDPMNGYGVTSGKQVIKTNNGGKDWEIVEVAPSNWPLETVFFLSKSTVFVAGIDGIFARTSDSGATWTNGRIHPRYSIVATKLLFADSVTGYVFVYRDSMYLKSVDAGRTWTEHYLDALHPVNNAHFSDADHGVVVSTNTLFHTSDGGLSWSDTTTVDTDITGVALSNPHLGVAVGKYGLIVRLDDANTTSIQADELHDQRDALSTQCFPNPASAAIDVTFTMQTSSHVNIDLYDLQGRKIMCAADQEFDSGVHTLSVQTHNLATGAYILIMQIGSTWTTRSVTVVH